MNPGATDDRVRLLPPLAPSPLGPGVALWELTLAPRDGDARLALLDDADRDRLGVRPPETGALLVTRRALVAVAVGALLGVPVEGLGWVRTGGRPRVTGPDGTSVHLSLSTSGDRALAAAAPHPVGVDLAVDQPVPEARVVSECLLAADERRWVEATSSPPATAARFLRTWVRKEAVVKATGEGLAGRPPQTFVVDARTDAPRPVRDGDGRPLGLWTCGVPLAGASAALAWPERPGPEAAGGPAGCT